jgi:hypothetical protein
MDPHQHRKAELFNQTFVGHTRNTQSRLPRSQQHDQSFAMADNRLRVGIIGAGEVAQVIHLPALAMLSHLYITTAVCDISKKVTT